VFSVGNIVIHPGYGACKIESIRKGKYVLRPNNHIPGDVKIFIAKENITDAGVHYPIKKNKIAYILRILNSEPNILSDDRSKGYPLTKEVISGGDLYKIAAAARDLTNSKNSSLHSSSGENLLKAAKKVLALELAHVKGISKDKIEGQLEKALNKKRSTKTKRSNKAHAFEMVS